MAQVIKALVGSGYLVAGQTTWWHWKITFGDAWYFWVDTASQGNVTTEMEILRVINRREGLTTNRAYVQLRNPGTTGTVFHLRVVRVV
jgi:hypothetical protein